MGQGGGLVSIIAGFLWGVAASFVAAAMIRVRDEGRLRSEETLPLVTLVALLLGAGLVAALIGSMA